MIDLAEFRVVGGSYIHVTAKIGENFTIDPFCIIYQNVQIGDNVIVKAHSRIDKGAKIGDNVKIRGHSVICQDMIIEGDNDLGHNLVCTNHIKMAAFDKNVEDKTYPPKICKGATIGTSCTLMPNVTIGRYAKVGESCTIRKDVGNYDIVINPNKTTFLKSNKDGMKEDGL